jgi:hypothetical protein
MPSDLLPWRSTVVLVQLRTNPTASVILFIPTHPSGQVQPGRPRLPSYVLGYDDPLKGPFGYEVYADLGDSLTPRYVVDAV